MEEQPSLTLIHSFTFRKNPSTYKISFYANCLEVQDNNGENDAETIQYADIYKIKSNGRDLRIYFRDESRMVIPCTISEIKKIKKLFKRSSSFTPSTVRSLAFVEFGELSFFIKIESNHYEVFKATIIKRIAKFFYPAFDQEGISLELFRNFMLKIKKGSRLVSIETSEDLDAALMYFDYKIDVIIEYSHD